jgi:hypothetical protein
VEGECTAIVRFTLLNVERDALIAKMNEVLPTLERQEGYVDSRVLVREGGTEVINILRWRDRSCHDRCQANPEMMAAGMSLLGLIQSGAVNMTVEVYESA